MVSKLKRRTLEQYLMLFDATTPEREEWDDYTETDDQDIKEIKMQYRDIAEELDFS